MKFNNFRGDVSVITAKKEPLQSIQRNIVILYLLCVGYSMFVSVFLFSKQNESVFGCFDPVSAIFNNIFFNFRGALTDILVVLTISLSTHIALGVLTE